jgi:fumigallin biosynthesis monooxygenase-like protein
MPGRVKQNGVVAGRQTAAYDGELVVFLIGMRVNKIRAVRQWLPVLRGMRPMLMELMADPVSGLLAFRLLPGLREATVVQYWSSVDKLNAFANDPQRKHRPAWVDFYKHSYADGTTGIWHETYHVRAGAWEAIYGNMPLLGLGEVAGVEPVSRRGETAAERLTR